MRPGEVGGSLKKGEDDQRRGATQDLHQGPQFISEKEIRAHLTFSSHSKPALNFLSSKNRKKLRRSNMSDSQIFLYDDQQQQQIISDSLALAFALEQLGIVVEVAAPWSKPSLQ